MVLADSSAWVEYVRRTGSSAHLALRNLIDGSAELCTTEVVYMEILSGVRTERELHDMTRLLSSVELVAMDPLEDYMKAAAIYRACRRGGETIRSMNDCLIAAVAIRTGAEVLHQDRDFDTIARYSRLRIYA